MWNICRTCMNKEVEMIPIFDRGKSPSINTMIMTISSLECLPNDTLPSEICVACVKTLEMTYYFKEQVIRSHNALQRQTKRSKLLGRCKMLAQQLAKEEEVETKEEDLSDEENEHVPIDSDSDAELSIENSTANIDDYSLQGHDPLFLKVNETYNSSSHCTVKSLNSELSLTSCDVDNLPEQSISDDVDVNSHFEETCTKTEEVEVEEHGMHFEDNSEITPEQIISKNEADDNEFSSEDDLPLNELQKSAEINPTSQDVQQHSNDKVEETTQAFKGKKRLRNVDYLPRKKRYKCEICGKAFRSVYFVNVHMRCHTGERPYKCQQCKATFKVLYAYNLHMRRHAETTAFKCHLCDANFTQRFHLNAHIRVHMGEAHPYKCVICAMTFEAYHQFTAHMKSHSGEMSFKCQHCDAVYTSSISLKRHIRVHTGEPKPNNHQCEICGKSFEFLHGLLSHRRSHTGERPFKCQYCNMGFTQGGNLKLHIKRKHRGEGESKSDKCENAGETLEAPGDLEMQMDTHAGERPFKCQQCDASFKHLGVLSRHIRLHAEKVAKPYICEFCEKAFEKPNYLKVHMRTHTGEKPFECQHCDAKYTKGSNLTVHMSRKHTIEGRPKLHQCEICGKRYEAVSELKIHMRYHTGERPFKCQQCNVAFARRTQLNKHNRVHSGEGIPKPHRCEVCEKTFEAPSGLRLHMASHSDERPFKCNHCKATFKLPKHLNRHVLTHVGKDTTKGKS